MSIIRVDISDMKTVKYITTETINSIYPHYYPEGAVDFFLGHHNDKNIENDIRVGIVYLCFDNENNAVGTVTVKENEICRLFVLPEYQGNGYGKGKSLEEAIICWRYKKNLKGHNRYEKSDLFALEKQKDLKRGCLNEK